ncbi:growth/differentiation factor 15 [Elgaria multicarinata webbii]|uniref:growth/differentiation factor 15 n=1 Tax=Elgaria multicarinata webbii TaxID=159646 RepID=UPI002FCD3E96
MPTFLKHDGRHFCTRISLLLLLLSGADLRPHGGPQEFQIDAVKQDILARLGLQRPPTLLKSPGREEVEKAQRLYQDLRAQLRRNQTKLAAAPTVHLLRPKLTPMGEASPGNLQASEERLYRLEFSRTAALHQDLHVLRAELTLFKHLLSLPGLSRFNVTWPAHVKIYRLAAGDRAAPELLASQELLTASQTLSLQDAVEQWLASSEPRLCLGLSFSADMGPLLEGMAALLLTVETQEQGRTRKARQVQQENCGTGDKKCCLRSLRVSFEAIGWDNWVVAPRSYSMYFCEGSCPHNYKPASMHAQIKARLHILSGETPAPCCVPAAYEPMVIMHYDSDGNVTAQLFDNMIVTRCHCA